MDSYLWAILLLETVLIALSAVFVGAETAIVSMSDSRIAKLAEEGDRRAKRIEKLTSKPSRFLATIRVAVTLAGFLGSALVADAFSGEIAAWLISLGVEMEFIVLDKISLAVLAVIVSLVAIVFGDLVPKRTAMKNPEKRALRVSGFISLVSAILRPFVWLLTAFANIVLRVFGIDPNADIEEVSEEDIKMMVDVGSEKGTIDDDEKEFIQNIFEFDDLTAGEIATHRTEIELLWLEEDNDTWRETIRTSRHTRYPICSETVDNVVGVLSERDYFRLEVGDRDDIMQNAVRPAYFVPETVKADILFRNMKNTHNSFAVVLDEYGGVTGIVTMNDLLERLVGDFNVEEAEDEEKEELSIEKVGDDLWSIKGNVTLEEMEEALEIPLSTEDYDTFSGLVFSSLGSIPDDGSEFEIEIGRLFIKVTEVSEHQIKSATVKVLEEISESDDEDEEE